MASIGGGAAASAGYHDRSGCIDTRTNDLSTAQEKKVIRAARSVGWAVWKRDAQHGGMDEHTHWVLLREPDMADGALEQEEDYLAGLDGLPPGAPTTTGGRSRFGFSTTPSTWRTRCPACRNSRKILIGMAGSARSRTLSCVKMQSEEPSIAVGRSMSQPAMPRASSRRAGGSLPQSTRKSWRRMHSMWRCSRQQTLKRESAVSGLGTKNLAAVCGVSTPAEN